MATKDDKVPPHIATGLLYREIERLPGDQRELVFGADQATRERIMALSGKARDEAIDALRKPETPADAGATKKKEA